MKNLLCLVILPTICLASLSPPAAWGDYILAKSVFSESGGHVESTSFQLDFSAGQVAVGQSAGSEHLESGGFLSWTVWNPPVSVDAEPTGLVPAEFILYQNYPNPFNPETRISYQLPGDDNVQLVIYNLRGQQVRTLVNERQASGHHIVTWDGRDQSGIPVATGVYFYHLTSGQFQQMRKMLLLK